jgi:hypothetical protein
MELRRAFQGEARDSKFWIAVAALFAVMALAVAGVYLAKGSASTAAPATTHVVLSGPGPMAPNVKDRESNSQPSQSQQVPAGRSHLRPGNF